MSTATMIPSGKYAVVECPRMLARRTGDIKNQYPLNATDFATIPAQNGMLLTVNEFTKEVKLPSGITDAVFLHSSPCKDYQGLGKDTIAVNRGELLPVMYKLQKGDKIITNCVRYTVETYATVAAITAAINTTTVYGIPGTAGYIDIVASAGGSETVLLKAVSMTTLSNGATAIEFVVILDA